MFERERTEKPRRISREEGKLLGRETDVTLAPRYLLKLLATVLDDAREDLIRTSTKVDPRDDWTLTGLCSDLIHSIVCSSCSAGSCDDDGELAEDLRLLAVRLVLVTIDGYLKPCG